MFIKFKGVLKLKKLANEGKAFYDKVLWEKKQILPSEIVIYKPKKSKDVACRKIEKKKRKEDY